MSIRTKTSEEIAVMREGGKRHSEILKLLSAMVKPGLPVVDLETEALRLIEEGGDEPAFLGYTPKGAKRPFPSALCVSVNEEIVHGIPTGNDRVLQEGDIVSLDLGLKHGGFITDSAVTLPVGQIDAESQKLLKVTKQALEQGIQSAKLGNTVGDIGSAISAVVEQSGFSLSADLAGHGVGYAVHEDPFVPNFGQSGEGEELVEGMVIAIEPMVNVGKPAIKVSTSDGYTISTRDGSRSAHFEHTVAITAKGPIILTL